MGSCHCTLANTAACRECPSRDWPIIEYTSYPTYLHPTFTVGVPAPVYVPPSIKRTVTEEFYEDGTLLRRTVITEPV